MFFERLTNEMRIFGYNNKLYFLHIEESENRVILTYEENPVNKDSFLLSTIGETKEQAAEKMFYEICSLIGGYIEPPDGVIYPSDEYKINE